MMELRHLRYFVTVAQEGSVTRAAARLYVVQSALSRQIRDLERHVGHRLFVRHTRGVVLTEAGLRLLPRAEAVLRQADRALRAARDASDAWPPGDHDGSRPQPGVLRLGLLQAGNGFVSSTLLNQTRWAVPRLPVAAVGVRLAGGLTPLTAGDVDLMVAPEVPGLADDRVEVRPLWEEPMVVGVGPGHPFAAAVTVPVLDLLEETFRPVTPGEPSAIDDFFTLRELRNGEPPRPRGERAFRDLGEVGEYLAEHNVIAPGGLLQCAPANLGTTGLHLSRLVQDAPPVRMALYTRRDPGGAAPASAELRQLGDTVAAVGARLIPHLVAFTRPSPG